MFANLKAFDKDRGKLWETLRGKGVSKYLVRKRRCMMKRR